ATAVRSRTPMVSPPRRGPDPVSAPGPSVAARERRRTIPTVNTARTTGSAHSAAASTTRTYAAPCAAPDTGPAARAHSAAAASSPVTGTLITETPHGPRSTGMRPAAATTTIAASRVRAAAVTGPPPAAGARPGRVRPPPAARPRRPGAGRRP